MEGVIGGNLCSLLAMVTDTVSSSRRTAKGVLLVQILSQVFYGLSAILLKGYSAAVQNAVSIVRNGIAIRNINKPAVQWLLVAAGLGFGLWFNNLGLVGLLPVAANLEYSVAVFCFADNERALKIAFAINAVLFLIFNAVILNIVGAAANVIVIVMTVFFLVREAKR